MSLFNGTRLDDTTFKLDIERMRMGWYADKYFVNIATMLQKLSEQGYLYQGQNHLLPEGITPENIVTGDIEVEMQWFTRRPGKTIVVGVDKALTMLKHATGYFKDGEFINTADQLEVWAVQDGDVVHYDGNPLHVQPVMRVRGRYRDFAILETSTLGILARASRIATNVYNTQVAVNGKPLMFFPARFDVHEVQAADGYAYLIAVQRYNLDYADHTGTFVSTDAQGDWWGGFGGGTISHSGIASFLGDTAEATLAFSRVLPVNISRIALVDFTNDGVGVSLEVCKAMFDQYYDLIKQGQTEEAKRYLLYGVRLDTSSSLRDVSVLPLGDPGLDLGVNPRLVFNTRQALDSAYLDWDLPEEAVNMAREYCQNVKIVVSGGFNVEKITKFEKLQVPADIYAVGSSLFSNYGPTNTDFTADVVRVKVHDEWIDMAKVGRAAVDNPDLVRVW
ncbi:MAG: nicotinate phosphoribosyltransferase [Anaerolineaceae bacterium]|jgi:nicotinate phosphoribosyltransferase|nr:nicotinate phosphoribosyltransferase [Anaerolineaceae bacterium]MDD4043517.1 nicotinate phosphoribosyltransferase [Anaerolineaceae bacterium]MDD4577319.1 nicotinate phosphoribosyltransferase [Anaerolineaceae bacterium]